MRPHGRRASSGASQSAQNKHQNYTPTMQARRDSLAVEPARRRESVAGGRRPSSASTSGAEGFPRHAPRHGHLSTRAEAPYRPARRRTMKPFLSCRVNVVEEEPEEEEEPPIDPIASATRRHMKAMAKHAARSPTKRASASPAKRRASVADDASVAAVTAEPCAGVLDARRSSIGSGAAERGTRR